MLADRRLHHVVAGLVIVLAACGESHGPEALPDAGADAAWRDADGTEDATPAGDVGAPDGAADAGLATLVVTALRGVEGEVFAPASGITVALDAPGGMRMEGTSDVAGRVTFGGIDWSLGTADVTAYAEGAPLHSIVGLDRIREVEIPVTDYARASHSQVTASGVLRNREPGYGLWLSQLSSPGIVFPTGTEYELPVPIGTPLTLVALQYLDRVPFGLDSPTTYWTVVSHDPIFADSTIDLDLGVHADPERVLGSARLARLPGLTGYSIEVRPSSARFEAGGLFGVSTETHPARDHVDYEVEFVRLLPEELVTWTLVGSSVRLSTGFSQVSRTGYPPSGTVDVEFLAVPLVAGSFDAPIPLHDPIRWEGDAPRAVFDIAREQFSPVVVWYVETRGNTHELHVPAAPSTVAPDAIGTDPLVARILLYDDESPVEQRISGSQFFELQP